MPATKSSGLHSNWRPEAGVWRWPPFWSPMGRTSTRRTKSSKRLCRWRRITGSRTWPCFSWPRELWSTPRTAGRSPPSIWLLELWTRGRGGIVVAAWGRGQRAGKQGTDPDLPGGQLRPQPGGEGAAHQSCGGQRAGQDRGDAVICRGGLRPGGCDGDTDRPARGREHCGQRGLDRAAPRRIEATSRWPSCC